MPKSRGRKRVGRGRAIAGRSGDPRRRARAQALSGLTDPYERAVSRLAGVVRDMDAADPLQVVSIPPLFIDMIAQEHGLPPQRCITDGLILVHAYAHLGIAAEARAVELTITDTTSGEHVTHGGLPPWWEDDLLHGHTALWVPEPGCLIDVTADQFKQLAPLDEGPVIASVPASASVPEQITHHRKHLRLDYTMGSRSETATVLDHPVTEAVAAEYPRRGLNVATVSVQILAGELPPHKTRSIPHPRAAALVTAARGLPEHRTPDDDRRFLRPGPDGTPTIACLDQLPLPPETPPRTQIH